MLSFYGTTIIFLWVLNIIYRIVTGSLQGITQSESFLKKLKTKNIVAVLENKQYFNISSKKVRKVRGNAPPSGQPPTVSNQGNLISHNVFKMQHQTIQDLLRRVQVTLWQRQLLTSLMDMDTTATNPRSLKPLSINFSRVKIVNTFITLSMYLLS